MNEFRIPSHNKRYDRKSVNRLGFMVFFFVGLILLFMYYLDKMSQTASDSISSTLDYLPDAKAGIVYHKPHFSLSYVEQYELPEWVAYTLSVEMLNRPKNERDQDFNPDPFITTGSGHYRDYKSSGYRRGHLVPSADMAWNQEAMNATFLLSNVAPMKQEFNDGIWLELEHNVRDWARKYRNIMVITGPVFNDPISTIGSNEILVPRYFYKAIFKTEKGKPEVIGFLFNQEARTSDRLEEYVVSIDSIENITGLDLFSNLYGSWDSEIASEKRGELVPGLWVFNEKWYSERVEGLKKQQ